MIDDMVGVLNEEQAKDDQQYKWCHAEIPKAEDEAKATKKDIDDLGAAIDEQQDAIATLSSDIEGLQAGLVELDKSVAEATEQRKKEHEESVDEAALNQATVDLLGMAKNRLNKFYNPSQYKEAFFAQVSVRSRQPGPAPETFGEYKKSEGSSGVLAMMDDMVRDVETDMAEGKRDEVEAQKDYEEEMADAATKRSDDSKLIVTKEGEKAEKDGKLEELKESVRAKSGTLDVLETKIADLHKKCDFLVKHFDEIRTERAKEMEGLKTSKQVLLGAKAGFLQRA